MIEIRKNPAVHRALFDGLHDQCKANEIVNGVENVYMRNRTTWDMMSSFERSADMTYPDLALSVINAREEERSRVGRELHDDLSQQFALFTIEFDQLSQMFPERANVSQQLQRLRDRIAEMSRDLHRLSHELYPLKLEQLGLGPAIRGLCRDFNAAGKIEVEFSEKGDSVVLSSDVRLCVFRIAQEALRNCTKHSQARKVLVVLEYTNGELRLGVSDDGVGFEVTADAMPEGLGFSSMRERVRGVKGRLVVTSEPDSGTSVEAWVPLEQETK